MKILYFARIREQIGTGDEDIDLPADTETVMDVLNHLRGRGDNYAVALENEDLLRIALDQTHCRDMSTPIGNVREMAIFPPMTGG